MQEYFFPFRGVYFRVRKGEAEARSCMGGEAHWGAPPTAFAPSGPARGGGNQPGAEMADRWAQRKPEIPTGQALGSRPAGPGQTGAAGPPALSAGALGSGGAALLGPRRQRRKDTRPPRWEWRRLQWWPLGFSQVPGAGLTSLVGGGRGLGRPWGEGGWLQMGQGPLRG